MSTCRLARFTGFFFILVCASFIATCARNPAPIEPDIPPPPPEITREPEVAPPTTPTTPPPVPEAPILEEDAFESSTLEELNRQSPLDPVFFRYDSFELDSENRSNLEASAETLRRYSSWEVTIEGHCDERGTAEYNLALGERRALIARDYLIELGLNPNRIRTVSYGKEFPFDPAHTEYAWQRNRRAHFVITAR